MFDSAKGSDIVDNNPFNFETSLRNSGAAVTDGQGQASLSRIVRTSSRHSLDESPKEKKRKEGREKRRYIGDGIGNR